MRLARRHLGRGCHRLEDLVNVSTPDAYGDPVADAKYRLAIALAAPALMAIISGLAVFMWFHPGVIGRVTCGLIGAGALGATNIGAYMYLGSGSTGVTKR